MKKLVALSFIFLLGGCAATSSGGSANELKSVEELRLLAEQGDVRAQADLGYCYQYGVGVKKDAQLALKWNLTAAEQGNTQAQHNLAVMYDEGIDIPEDNTEAVKWYRKAAEQGHDSAQLNLGICYWQGEGVGKDYEQAWKWLNHVRVTSPNNQAKWQARAVLDKIIQKMGFKVGRLQYPAWEDLQKK